MLVNLADQLLVMFRQPITELSLGGHHVGGTVAEQG